MEMFLLRNGYEIESSVDDQEAVFLGVAAGEIGRVELATWVEARIIRRRHR
jgi:death-on-curing protein